MVTKFKMENCLQPLYVMMICFFCLGKAKRTRCTVVREKVWQGSGSVVVPHLSSVLGTGKAPKDDEVSGGNQSISDSTGRDSVAGGQAGGQNTTE